MATAASIGLGAIVEVRSGTATDSAFVSLAEITNINPPSNSVDQIDVTHMASPNRTREFIPGLSDAGEMTVEMNYVPSSTTDDFIIAWRASGETRTARITYPNAAVTDTFSSFPLAYAPSGITVGDKMSATLTLKVAGAVTRVG